VPEIMILTVWSVRVSAGRSVGQDIGKMERA
jgi:hypothetical protein